MSSVQGAVRGSSNRSQGRDGWQKHLLPFPQQGGKRTQPVSISSFRWHEPAGRPTQDVRGGLQDVLSQQEHPLVEGGELIRAVEQ